MSWKLTTDSRFWRKWCLSRNFKSCRFCLRSCICLMFWSDFCGSWSLWESFECIGTVGMAWYDPWGMFGAFRRHRCQSRIARLGQELAVANAFRSDRAEACRVFRSEGHVRSLQCWKCHGNLKTFVKFTGIKIGICLCNFVPFIRGLP